MDGKVSMLRFGGVAGAFVGGWLACAPAAMAQIPQPATQTPKAGAPGNTTQPTSAAKDKLAHELYKRGDKKFAAGEYPGAARDFERAYELSGRSALLYNLANAYEQLERYDDALRSLRAYLPTAPAARKVEVESRIVKLEPLAADQRNAPPKPTPGPTPDPVVPPSTPLSGQAIAGISLMGVGVLGLGAGAVFGGLALGARSDAEAFCSAAGASTRCTAEARDALDDDETFSLVADVGFGVGGVALAVGAGLFIADLLSADEDADSADGSEADDDTSEVSLSALSVAPTIAPTRGGAFVGLVGRF